MGDGGRQASREPATTLKQWKREPKWRRRQRGEGLRRLGRMKRQDLGVNTTLKGKGGGLPEDSPGPPGEPGGTAAITGMTDRLPGGRGSRATPGLGWPCGRPPDGHMGPRREEMRPSWAEDRPRTQPVPHHTGDRQGGPGKETGGRQEGSRARWTKNGKHSRQAEQERHLKSSLKSERDRSTGRQLYVESEIRHA